MTSKPYPVVSSETIFARALDLHAGRLRREVQSTGWPSLDPLYRVAPAQWTVITGIPGAGKSEFLDALLVNLATAEDWEFAVYSPEKYPTEEHLISLAEKRSGKPFATGRLPRMTRDEFSAAAMWVLERFFWLEPELRTPVDLLSTGLAYGRPAKRRGIVLDPWNCLEHERMGMSETDYISKVLSDVTRIARASNAHIWLVAHPAKLPRDRDGRRPIPTPYDIAGSHAWFSKADNILCVHRDKDDETNEVLVAVQKVRFKWVGRVGEVVLHYDRPTGRYSDPAALEEEGAAA